MQPIHPEVESIFQKILSDPTLTLTDETTHANLFQWDSLTHMLIILEIENRFNIRFTVTEVAHARDIRTLKSFISMKTGS